MASTTRFLRNFKISPRNLDRLVKIIKCKIIGMPKTVRSLGGVLTDKIGWRMTIVAGGDGLVAGFLPAVILVVHNMTVCTSHRIVAHVRISLCVNEREQTNADGKSDSDSYNYEFDRLERHSHLVSNQKIEKSSYMKRSAGLPQTASPYRVQIEATAPVPAA